VNRAPAVLTNPSVIPRAPTPTPFRTAGSCSFLRFPLSTLFGLMCVDVIALGWKGLASHDAKNTKTILWLVLLWNHFTVSVFIILSAN
uniref:Uncharacterized protein n=1 Tax=Equus caballus TaxID=9796 RepID=A0A9L0TAK0_HORSE